MTNLTAPTAEAAKGVSRDTMADVIDSLKRLERIGSEQSKTTQKLIDAAEELASLIVAQFRPRRGESIDIEFELPTQPGEDALLSFPETVHYSVMAGDPEDGLSASGRLYHRDGLQVGANRDSALQFSRDIAQGLLDAICATLEKRQSESAKAFPVLEHALTAFQKTRTK